MRVVSSIEEIYVGSHEPRLIFRNLALASLTIEYILRLGLLVITPSSLAIHTEYTAIYIPTRIFTFGTCTNIARG